MKEQSEGRKEGIKKEEKGQSLYYIHSLPFFIAECVAALDLNGKKEKEEGGDELEEDRAYRTRE
jgi:hypothetical protein